MAFDLPSELLKMQEQVNKLKHSAAMEGARDDIIGYYGSVPIQKETLQTVIAELELSIDRLEQLCHRLDALAPHRNLDIYESPSLYRE